MRVGDVILQIAGREIEDVSSFRDIVEELEGRGRVPVLLVRDGNPLCFLATLASQTKSPIASVGLAPAA